ncbi:3-oxoacyl-[ACP] reductase [hydrothermal vent metagenome]|uniref:3-oxoacyl-[ACP] reductase n=1 Tax=hydrothermal vent metagenome TaxID=652676 RepID=A0A3B1AAY7_9ZZZZ
MSRRVLVTGSSRGIGKAIALELAKEGFLITVHYRSGEEDAKSVVDEIISAGGQADLIGFDISERQQTRSALEGIIEQHGAYYGVVSNAGITRDGAFPALTDEDWDQVIHTNLDGFFNVVQPLIMPMVRAKKGGRIIAMSSVSGVMGNRGQTNYAASKAGLIGAVKSLALELAKRKITVNCIAPGLIETDMIDETVLKEAMKFIPARRMGKPEEIAGLARYLFSDNAAYITRQVISVNGGMA